MEQIKAGVEKAADKVKCFAADHPKTTVAGAAVVGGVVGLALASTKVGLVLITVTGVLAVGCAGAAFGKTMAEAVIRSKPVYLPPPQTV